MKIISVILSVLMLGLSILPCDDSMAGHNDCGVEIHFHATEGHDHGPNSDNCSPFCICQCCHTNIISDTPPSENAGVTHTGEYKQRFIRQHYPEGVITDIWRPPQFA